MGDINNKTVKHCVTIENRRAMSLTGITKVNSVEPELVLVLTDNGKLKICGKNMQANTLDLDKGILSLTGDFNSLVYSGDKEGALSLKGLFK